MSGIVGLWQLDGAPVEERQLQQLSAPLTHRGPDGEGRWRAGPVGLACQLFRVTPEATAEVQPLVHPQGVVVFDGRLDNREELWRRLPASPLSAASTDPDFILAAYLAWGDDFPAYLNGDFALAVFDPRESKLILARDPLGLRPLYYWRDKHTLLFASEIKAILAHPRVSPRPDDHFLAHCLLGGLGRGHQELTFFAGIMSLPPAHSLVLTPQGCKIQRYWDFDPAPPVRLASFQDYAERFRELFAQAVRRRLRSAAPVAVSVSGGLDSSAIFCQALTLRQHQPEKYENLLGVTLGYEDGSLADESRYIRALEQMYQIEVVRVPPGPVGLTDGCRKAVWHLESPLLTSQWGQTERLQQTVQQLGARVLLTGHWGDQVLLGFGYLIDFCRRLKWGRVRAHLQEIPRWFTDSEPHEYRRIFWQELLRHFFPENLLPLVRRLRDKMMANGLARSCFTEKMFALSYQYHREAEAAPLFDTVYAADLYQETRLRDHALALEWNNKAGAMHGLEMAFPFLDRDLLAFLLRLPGEIQTWRGVPKALLRQGLRPVLPAAIAARRWKADFTHLVRRAAQEHHQRILDTLVHGGKAVQWGYVKETLVGEEVLRVKDSISIYHFPFTRCLSNLYGLELWLQTFFG